MKKILASRKEVNYEDYIRRPAKREDFETLITEDAILYDEAEPEKPILLYFKFSKWRGVGACYIIWFSQHYILIHYEQG